MVLSQMFQRANQNSGNVVVQVPDVTIGPATSYALVGKNKGMRVGFETKPVRPPIRAEGTISAIESTHNSYLSNGSPPGTRTPIERFRIFRPAVERAASKLAAQARLELASFCLTGRRSTVELPCNKKLVASSGLQPEPTD